MTPRYTVDGREVEGTIVDSDGRPATGSTNKSPSGMTLEDLLGALREAKGAIAAAGQGTRTSIAEAIARSRQIQEAEAKFPNPGTAELKVRHSGILHTPDPRDQARFDADKANYDLAILEAHMVALIAQYIVSGKQLVMDGIKHLILMDNAYPAAVQPFGQLLNEWGIELLIEVYKQGGEQQAVFMLEEIARAATYRP
jgi:hypothetical protein